MSDPEDRDWGLRTRAIHAGARPDPTTGARAVPIYQTTSFVFENTEDAADLFALQKYGNIYTRLGNPTVAAFEERIASLEGGIGAVATGSGQAAETLLFTQLCDAGDHIVASSALYGGTYTLLNVTLRRLGIETTFVAPDDPQAFADAVQPGRTKLVYTEIVANPAGTVADLEALAKVAHDAGVPLAVDSTLASPVPVPPAGLRRRHRPALGDQVPGRPRHLDRRRDRRLRPLPVGQRQLPGDDRAGRHLRQPALLGQLRRVRLRHQAACRGPAQPRRRAVAVQRLPDPAGHGDAAAADGGPRGQRAEGRGMARASTRG